MSDHPTARLAMGPKVLPGVFPPDVLDRLGRVVTLDRDHLITSFDDEDLAAVEILVTSWRCPVIDDAALEVMPELRAVVHGAGSVKRHVTPEVLRRGIQVSSAAAANAIPVAEFTIAMVVLSAKRTFEVAQAYAAGTAGPGHVPGERTGVYNSTVGVIGASKIGRAVIPQFKALGANVLVSDPYLGDAQAAELGAELVDLDELFRRSDTVTIHAPALAATQHMVDARRLKFLRDGAVVINTARGALVDTDALTEECRSGRISAILDVTDPEPLPSGHPLFEMPNVLVTPHLAGARGRELRRLGEFAVADVERLVRGEPMLGLVREHDLDRIA